MPEAKHTVSYTPAPWKTAPASAHHKKTLVYSADGSYICFAQNGGMREYSPAISLDCAEANARLIAAAPELLESAKEMRDACAACFRVIAETGAIDRLEKELLRAGCVDGFGKRAQDIILKAEGRNV